MQTFYASGDGQPPDPQSSSKNAYSAPTLKQLTLEEAKAMLKSRGVPGRPEAAQLLEWIQNLENQPKHK